MVRWCRIGLDECRDATGGFLFGFQYPFLAGLRASCSLPSLLP